MKQRNFLAIGLSIIAGGASSAGAYTYTANLFDVTGAVAGGAFHLIAGGNGSYSYSSDSLNVLGENLVLPQLTVQLSTTTSDWIDILTVDGNVNKLGVGGTESSPGAQDDAAVHVFSNATSGSSSNQSYITFSPSTGGAATEVDVYTFSYVSAYGLIEGTPMSNAVYGTLHYNLTVNSTDGFGGGLGSSSTYGDAANWALGGTPGYTAPNGVDAIGIFESASVGRTVNLPSAGLTLGTLGIDSSSAYTLAGSASLTLQSSNGPAQVIISQGAHTINAPLAFGSDTTMQIAPAASLDVTRSIAVSGIGLTIQGGGSLNSGGILKVASNGSLTINASSIQDTTLNIFDSSSVNLRGSADGAVGSTSFSSESVGTNALNSPNSTNAVFSQSGGTNTVGQLTVGSNFSNYSDVGTYNLSNGLLSATTINIAGHSGCTGYFNQSAGALSATTLAIGSYGMSTGSYNLGGGGISAQNETIASGSSGGANGITGTLTQVGGSNTISTNLTIGNSTGTSVIAKYSISGGSLSVGGIIHNYGNGVFEYDGGTVSGNVDNYGTFNVRGGGTETLTGNFTNETGATLKTYGTTFAVTGTFTNNGTYSSDPATNNFASIAIGKSGTLLGGVGDKFIVAGNLTSSSTKSTAWNTEQASLAFNGTGNHLFDVNGSDAGPSWSGYENNFAWGVLSLGSDQSLSLTNASANDTAGLYVGTLQLADGLSELSSINADGVNVYYDAALNPWLSDGSYRLAGGGELLPITGDGGAVALSLTAAVPEPGSLSVLGVVAAGLMGRRRRRA